MIQDNKKLNPFLGVAIGFALIFVGMYGALSLLSDILDTYLSLIIMLPIFVAGSTFLKLNSYFIGYKMLAKKMDKNAESMNPITFLDNQSIIMKVNDLYIVKNLNNCLHIFKMDEKINISVSWIRRVFLGPKLPLYNPKSSPVEAEFDGFQIRKRVGNVKLFEFEENQWITGQATIFIIFSMNPLKLSIDNLLIPKIFQNFINVMEKIDLLDSI